MDTINREWSGVRQWDSETAVSINSRARTHIYILGNCCLAVSLSHFWLFIPSPRTPLCLPKTIPFWGGVDMPSTRGRPAIDPRKTPEGIEGGKILIIVRLLMWVRYPDKSGQVKQTILSNQRLNWFSRQVGTSSEQFLEIFVEIKESSLFQCICILFRVHVN